MSNAQAGSTDPIIAELRRVRRIRGLSQQEVADKAGISRRALVSIEAGNDCTLSTLRALGAALGVHVEAKTPGLAEMQEPAAQRAFSFSTTEALSAHQEQRELAEALRVQAMSSAERSRWLSTHWGRLQRQATALGTAAQMPRKPRVMHFATLGEKNRHDEQQEIEQALSLAQLRG